MKLIIQIPAFNEVGTLAETVADLPRHIDGVDIIEYLVIDDGSHDGTSELAHKLGVHHVVRHTGNRGLARGFQTGIDTALSLSADIIVNTDADNQYAGQDIEKLVRPILDGTADIVIGDRQVGDHAHFSWLKQRLQQVGSFVVGRLSNTDVPDAVSGFRAISRKAAQRIHILSDFSYTTEMLIQAGRNRLTVAAVPIRTNKVDRPSRLFGSIPGFIMRTGTTIVRAYAMYYPLRVFMMIGLISALIGVVPILRFVYFFFVDGGQGHVQSLVIGGTLFMLGIVAMMLGILADLIGRNRQLNEATLERIKRVEFMLARQELNDLELAPRKITAKDLEHAK